MTYQNATSDVLNFVCPLDLVTSDIAVADFPDYVLRVTEEDEHNNSMLAQEYWVF